MSELYALRQIAEATSAVVEEAVALVLRMLQDPVRDWRKGDRSPVTEIDLAVDDLLARRLPVVAKAAWLSEETADRPERLKEALVWIVDPIDGTSALISQTPEFCISVALVERGSPIVGVIANPLTGERFVACRGGGAFDGTGARLSVRPSTLASRTGEAEEGHGDGIAPPSFKLLVSNNELRRGLWRELDASFDVSAVSSLAYKLAKVARGDVDATMTPWPRSEWDAAAGDLLVREAGGFTVDIHGVPLTYNHSTPVFAGVVAGGRAALDHLAPLRPLLLRRRKVVEQRWIDNQAGQGDTPSHEAT